MSVLFVPYPAYGHMHPMLPVIAELVARGLSVRVVVERRHAIPVRAVGAAVRLLPVAADVYVPGRRIGRDTARYVAGRVRKPLVGLAAARLVAAEIERDRPSLVVVDPMMGAADRTASRAGVRTALFSTTYARPATLATKLWPVVRRFGRDRLVLVNTLRELQPAAERFGANVYFLGPLLRHEPRADLQRYGLPTTRQVLLVSTGTVFGRTPTFFRAIARAFADTPWHVIMATGPVDPAAIGPLPDNVLAASYVPQLAVLAHTAVFVTHAGMNSALEALSRGVPMLVFPREGDQMVLARRLVDLGVAVRVPRHLSRVRETVERAANDPVLRTTTAQWRARLQDRATIHTAADLLMNSAGRPDH